MIVRPWLPGSRLHAASAAWKVTAQPSVNTIWYVPSRPAQLLTKRRAVDFCLVATAICWRSAPAAA